MVFTLQHNTPTDPVHSFLGANASKTAIKAEWHKLGYERPIVEQYVRYVRDMFHGNFQMSLRTRRPVATDLRYYLPATIKLALFGLLFAIVLAAILRIATAARFPGAGVFRFITLAGASTPLFLFALLGILLFYHRLAWLPATGRTSLSNSPTRPTGFLTVDTLLRGNFHGFTDAISRLILPALCIAILPAVSIGRVLRSSLTTNLRSDYVHTARSKGLRETAVLWHHAVRNSLGPALSMGGFRSG